MAEIKGKGGGFKERWLYVPELPQEAVKKQKFAFKNRGPPY